jgi:hypothetical protein
LLLALAPEVDVYAPPATPFGIEGSPGSAHRIPGEAGRAQPQPVSVLVLWGQFLGWLHRCRGRRCSGRSWRRRVHARHRMKGELGGTANDLHGLLGVGHARELHDDAPASRALQGGLCNAQGVNPSPQDLEGAGGSVTVDLLAVGIPGLEHDLRATFEIQAQSNRAGGNESSGAGHDGDDSQGAPTIGVGQCSPSARPPTGRHQAGLGRLEKGWAPGTTRPASQGHRTRGENQKSGARPCQAEQQQGAVRQQCDDTGRMRRRTPLGPDARSGLTTRVEKRRLEADVDTAHTGSRMQWRTVRLPGRNCLAGHCQAESGEGYPDQNRGAITPNGPHPQQA